MKSPVQEAIDNIAEQLKPAARKSRLVYAGRFCPMHFGHQAILGGIIKASNASDNGHLIVLGSCNRALNYRSMFDFADRVRFIKTVYPEISIAPLPDFESNTDWLNALDMLIELTDDTPEQCTYVGGCEEDICWFIDDNRNTKIINRFGGQTLNVSGTEIRDHLITNNHEKLKEMLDPRIIPDVTARFAVQWDRLRRQ